MSFEDKRGRTIFVLCDAVLAESWLSIQISLYKCCPILDKVSSLIRCCALERLGLNGRRDGLVMVCDMFESGVLSLRLTAPGV